MLNLKSETLLAKILAYGAAFVAVFLISNQVSDPVNATKLLALGATSIAASAILFFKFTKQIIENFRLVALISTAFLLLGLMASVNSDSPFVQNFYGSYGRNTGYLTYLLLALILLSALVLTQNKNFKHVIYGLFAAGLINVAYCLWVLMFGDFISWNNPYGNILGTFGNPNFIGSFLGIFVSTFVAYLAQPGLSWKMRSVGLIVVMVTFYEIRMSHAVQGIVVSAGGIALVGLFVLRNRFKSWLIPAIYSLGVGIVGFAAIMGALQKGPLSSIVYKTSVSLRGEYWQAAFNMAQSHPLRGIGMDSYGDWFRRMRDDQALVLPGPNVVTNAAHNVALDVLAYGGWPLFICYFLLVIMSFVSIVKVVARKKQYDWVFVSLAVGWICYQVQSLISINQIGLAVWGWLLSGCVIAYEKATRDSNEEVTSQPAGRKISKESLLSPHLLAGIGTVVGLLIAVPPLNADMSLRKALTNQDLNQVKVALTSSYMRPTNSFSLGNTISIFESNNLNDLAHEYALKAIEFNPSNFDAWRLLYSIKNSTTSEKSEAKKNMIRLDPLNPEWKKLP